MANPVALITGAARTEGLGYAFAKQLAAKGHDLILVDISQEVEDRAKEINASHSVTATPLIMDLSVDFTDTLEEKLGDTFVDLLVANHMYSPTDVKFLDMSPELVNKIVDTNGRSYALLMHYFGNKMREADKGTLVIVASMVAYAPTPYMAAYAGNKAMQAGLARALWWEMKDTNVEVMTVLPGMTDTGPLMRKYPSQYLMSPDAVVTEVIASLGKKPVVIPGRLNKVLDWVQRLTSRPMAVNNMGNVMLHGVDDASR